MLQICNAGSVPSGLTTCIVVTAGTSNAQLNKKLCGLAVCSHLALSTVHSDGPWIQQIPLMYSTMFPVPLSFDTQNIIQLPLKPSIQIHDSNHNHSLTSFQEAWLSARDLLLQRTTATSEGHMNLTQQHGGVCLY